MTSPCFTRLPSATPSHSSRPVAFDEIAALRWATTRAIPYTVPEAAAKFDARVRRDLGLAVDAPPALIDLGKIQIDLAGLQLTSADALPLMSSNAFAIAGS